MPCAITLRTASLPHIADMEGCQLCQCVRTMQTLNCAHLPGCWPCERPLPQILQCCAPAAAAPVPDVPEAAHQGLRVVVACWIWGRPGRFSGGSAPAARPVRVGIWCIYMLQLGHLARCHLSYDVTVECEHVCLAECAMSEAKVLVRATQLYCAVQCFAEPMAQLQHVCDTGRRASCGPRSAATATSAPAHSAMRARGATPTRECTPDHT